MRAHQERGQQAQHGQPDDERQPARKALGMPSQGGDTQLGAQDTAEVVAGIVAVLQPLELIQEGIFRLAGNHGRRHYGVGGGGSFSTSQ